MMSVVLSFLALVLAVAAFAEGHRRGTRTAERDLTVAINRAMEHGRADGWRKAHRCALDTLAATHPTSRGGKRIVKALAKGPDAARATTTTLPLTVPLHPMQTIAVTHPAAPVHPVRIAFTRDAGEGAE